MTTDQQFGGEAGGGDRPATDMATLLEESEDYRTPQRGEIVEGTIMGWDRDGLLVDIGAKSEGIVPRNELQSLGPDPESRLGGGDKVFVFVTQPEGTDGQIVLSVDRARGEQGWHTLQEKFESGEVFDAVVSGHNKGGLLVNVEGVNAFVPMSQVVGFRPDRGREDGSGGGSLADAVGKSLRLKVIEINRRRNRVILSERAALQEWRSEQKERLIQELREGDIRRGRITSVRSFGVFVDLGGADGLAHLSELSWERDKSPMDLFNVGDEVDVYITKIDAENKKIALSLRRARPEQWDAIVDKYKEDQVVVGRITKLVTFGAFARIEGPVEGLIHVSELVDRRIGHPNEVVREGDLLPLKVVRIERDRQRLGLSLRRARDEGEQMGFVFTDGGEVLSVPDDIRQEFEAREGPPPARTESYTDDRGASDLPAAVDEDESPAAIEPVAESEQQPAIESVEAPVAAFDEEAGALDEPAGIPQPAESEPAVAEAQEMEPVMPVPDQFSDIVASAEEAAGAIAQASGEDTQSASNDEDSVDSESVETPREEAVTETADHITAG